MPCFYWNWSPKDTSNIDMWCKGVAHSWSVDNVNQNNVNRENSCRYRTFYRLGNIYKLTKLSDVFDMKVVTK